MNQREINKNESDLIFLVSCAVNKTIPDTQRCADMDEAAVFNLASRHMLSSAAAYALEKVMPLPQHWQNAKGNAKRRLVIYQAERARVLQALDERGIWYLPLKGIILKDMYPETSLREMSDNDILCDGEKMGEIKSVMNSLGFTCVEFGKKHHDVYHKGLTRFEMHSKPFSRAEYPEGFSYYVTIKKRLIKDDNNSCGYHMTDDDLYIYCVNHMYKHYSDAGTGLRSLLDIYVFNKVKGQSLDRGYIGGELDCCGIREFELKTRLLAEKVFSLQTLTESDKAELAVYLDSGTYGTTKNMVSNRLENDGSKKAKRRYLLRRFFPGEEQLEMNYPIVYRHRVLYPFLVICRPFKGLVTKPKTLLGEFRSVRDYNKTDDNNGKR